MTRKRTLRFAIIINFLDEVELDVVLLDIYSLVLGSPYLYDRREIFHLHENFNHSLSCETFLGRVIHVTHQMDKVS